MKRRALLGTLAAAAGSMAQSRRMPAKQTEIPLFIKQIALFMAICIVLDAKPSDKLQDTKTRLLGGFWYL